MKTIEDRYKELKENFNPEDRKQVLELKQLETELNIQSRFSSLSSPITEILNPIADIKPEVKETINIDELKAELLTIESALKNVDSAELRAIAKEIKLKISNASGNTQTYFSELFNQNFKHFPDNKMIRFDDGAIYNESEINGLFRHVSEKGLSIIHLLKKHFNANQIETQADINRFFNNNQFNNYEYAKTISNRAC